MTLGHRQGRSADPAAIVDELRYLDHIDDAAFLAMDLEFLGREDLGDYFLDRYAAGSGDAAPWSLRDFYIAYRAGGPGESRLRAADAGQAGGRRSLDAGLCAPANVAAVYEAILHRAGPCLANGQSVILDGTWRDGQVRAEARRLAADKHAAMAQIQCVVPVDVAADRIQSRAPGNSDATPQIAAALIAQDFEWDTAHRIDTAQPLDDCVCADQGLWRAAIKRP